MEDKPLAEKLRMQEKEKLMIERTLAHLLNQSNIHLPKDVRVSVCCVCRSDDDAADLKAVQHRLLQLNVGGARPAICSE